MNSHTLGSGCLDIFSTSTAAAQSEVPDLVRATGNELATMPSSPQPSNAQRACAEDVPSHRRALRQVQVVQLVEVVPSTCATSAWRCFVTKRKAKNASRWTWTCVRRRQHKNGDQTKTHTASTCSAKETEEIHLGHDASSEESSQSSSRLLCETGDAATFVQELLRSLKSAAQHAFVAPTQRTGKTEIPCET